LGGTRTAEAPVPPGPVDFGDLAQVIGAREPRLWSRRQRLARQA